jgi:hypothetical protein
MLPKIYIETSAECPMTEIRAGKVHSNGTFVEISTTLNNAVEISPGYYSIEASDPNDNAYDFRLVISFGINPVVMAFIISGPTFTLKVGCGGATTSDTFTLDTTNNYATINVNTQHDVFNPEVVFFTYK